MASTPLGHQVNFGAWALAIVKWYLAREVTNVAQERIPQAAFCLEGSDAHDAQ
jgi:hypothetical protein